MSDSLSGPRLDYPFTEEESKAAFEEWGCNCGPTALGFVLQTPLDVPRRLIEGFEAKRYTSPTMMRKALMASGRAWSDVRPASIEKMFQWKPCLVRIQWTGPWTAPGANPKWAYRQSHWIATYMVERQAPMVFDVNGGIRGFSSWREEIVPLLVASYPRADGGWKPTHVWSVLE